ncbi:hypothetical protein M9458_007502, partial [Cirrhinus mrigala]
ELVQTFIRNILMMNYRARYIRTKENNEEDHTQQKDNLSSEDECDIFQAMSLSNKGTSQSERIDPMDVQMAVFHCADGFLKQLMVTKLSQCQYALPLLVPDPFTQQIEFPLWTFRQINKSWKMRNTSNEIISQTQPIYKAQTPMVFFFRFGSVSSSKSHLMNSLINERHNTFFHRNCPGSSTTRVLMDGVVEIAWFCPSGTNDDKFTECVAFCNLHGDAGDHEKQLQILTEMASVNVVLLPRLDRDDKHAAKIQNLVDEEDDDDCRRGREAAQQMMSLLEKKNLREIKESFLPHQGKLWHQWSQKNKELHRPKADETEMDISRKHTEMKKIRQQQHESEISEFMKFYIKKMNADAPNKMFFLKWLKMLLGEYISADLYALRHKYDEKWSIVLKLKENHDKSEQLQVEQAELEKISEEIQATAFGLEHIMREIGQIYESCSAVRKIKEELQFHFSSLPSLAAEMMISGFPLELMDGDAAHVPVIWISAVLDELKMKLGDQRVFVLSGKSTMLNAMFGLQFARSFHAAELGRSTRHHDNELATFVVGLGNLTLINIFGENPSEMQDILQIVVQAFMRMKKNVSDVSAGEKNMEGRRRLQVKLDEMTKLAAKEEPTNGTTKSKKFSGDFSLQETGDTIHAMMETENKLHNRIENEAIDEVEESDLQKELNKTSEEHSLFREANDPVQYVERKRKEYYSIFQKFCHGATSAAIFGEIICQKLKKHIEQSVYKKTARDLADEIRSNCESLNGNRSKLEKHILKTLAEEEDFYKYLNYINNPRDHFKSFIRDEVSQYITDKFSVSVLPKMKGNIKLLQQKIMKAAHESTEHFQLNSGDVYLWLKSFTQQLSDVLIFSVKDLSGVKHDGVNVKLIEDVIRKELPAITSDVSGCFNNFLWKLDYKDRPDELLIDHFCQCCWVQCPFCRAICTNTIENHDGDHSVPFHRIDGLNGFYHKGTHHFCTEFCSTVVTSGKSFKSSGQWFLFKDYRKAGGVYADWSITPDLSELPYWKWFVCRFQNDLEKHYDKSFQGKGAIPEDWRQYTKEDAIESVGGYYTLR